MLLITILRKFYCYVWIFGKVVSKNVAFSCTLCALLSGVTRNSRSSGQISKSSPLSPFPTVLPLYTFTTLSLPFCAPTPPRRVTMHSRGLNADGNSCTRPVDHHVRPVCSKAFTPANFRPTLDKVHSQWLKWGGGLTPPASILAEFAPPARIWA